jgi:hypothetical protein
VGIGLPAGNFRSRGRQSVQIRRRSNGVPRPHEGAFAAWPARASSETVRSADPHSKTIPADDNSRQDRCPATRWSVYPSMWDRLLGDSRPSTGTHSYAVARAKAITGIVVSGLSRTPGTMLLMNVEAGFHQPAGRSQSRKFRATPRLSPSTENIKTVEALPRETRRLRTVVRVSAKSPPPLPPGGRRFPSFARDQ